MKTLLPYNEENRLRVLRRYAILDTEPEEQFDRIVLQAAARFDTPIALFTLIDEDRQWFKSRIGLDIRETDRASSFCAHAIPIDAPLVVEDAAQNPVFACNPLVVGYPGIAFYAGVPVRAITGEALGALCVIDTTPRSFAWQDLLLLQEYSAQIEERLEVRRAELRSSPGRASH